jgi:hypothetical protein
MESAEPGPITTGGIGTKEDVTTCSRNDSGLWLWVPAPVRNCAQGGDDSEGEVRAHTRFIDTETFGPFLMVWYTTQ